VRTICWPWAGTVPLATVMVAPQTQLASQVAVFTAQVAASSAGTKATSTSMAAVDGCGSSSAVNVVMSAGAAMETLGGAVSTTTVAGVVATVRGLPAESDTVAVRVWLPSARIPTGSCGKRATPSLTTWLATSVAPSRTVTVLPSASLVRDTSRSPPAAIGEATGAVNARVGGVVSTVGAYFTVSGAVPALLRLPTLSVTRA